MATDHRARARELRNRYDQDAAEIRADGSLSAGGKAERLREEWTKAATGISAARRAHEQERKDRLAALHKSLFGPSHRENERPLDAASSYQSEIEHAERNKTPEEAMHMLERSQMVGNDRLAKAIGLVAAERQWPDVVDAWLDKVPEKRADWVAFSELNGRPLTTRFGESVTFGSPARPSEVRALELRTLDAPATPVGLRGASNGARG